LETTYIHSIPHIAYDNNSLVYIYSGVLKINVPLACILRLAAG